MKLFLAVALSLMMIALIAHAQSLPPPYPPPPNYPPPAYAPPPPGMMAPPTYAPPQAQPFVPQQAMPPVMPPTQTQLQPQPPARPALQAQQQGNITFVSGGAGTEDRDALRQVESQYNLRLLFAARNGDYLANVAVTLSDARGNAVLDTIAEGPIFYARVPPGRYRLTVSEQGQSQSRDVSIGNGAVRHDFYWASAG